MTQISSPTSFTSVNPNAPKSDFAVDSKSSCQIKLLIDLSACLRRAPSSFVRELDASRLSLVTKNLEEKGGVNLKIRSVFSLKGQSSLDVFQNDSKLITKDDHLSKAEYDAFVKFGSDELVEEIYVQLVPQVFLGNDVIEAIHSGNLPWIEEWVGKDRSRLQLKTSEGENLAYHALHAGSVEILNWLYNQDPTLIQCVRRDGQSLLFLAVSQNKRNILDWLLSEGGSSYSPPIFVLDAFELISPMSINWSSEAITKIGWFMEAASFQNLVWMFELALKGVEEAKVNELSKAVQSFDRALKYLDEVVAREKVSINHDLITRIKLFAAVTCYKQGKSKVSKESFLSAVSYVKRSISMFNEIYGESRVFPLNDPTLLSLDQVLEAFPLDKLNHLELAQVLNTLNNCGLVYLDKALKRSHKGSFDQEGKKSLWLAIFYFSYVLQAKEKDREARTGNILQNLGRAYLEDKQFDQAIDCFRKFHQRESNRHNQNDLRILVNWSRLDRAYIEQAHFFMNRGLLYQAFECFKESLEIKKVFSVAKLNHGSQEKKNFDEETLSALETCVINTQDGYVYKSAAHEIGQLGEIFEQNGDLDLARECFKISVSLRQKLHSEGKLQQPTLDKSLQNLTRIESRLTPFTWFMIKIRQTAIFKWLKDPFHSFLSLLNKLATPFIKLRQAFFKG